MISTISGSQSGIVVVQAAATGLVVSGFMSPTTAGDSQTFVVKAVDSNGMVVPSYAGTVHFTSTDAQVSAGNGLPSDYTFTTGPGGDDGIHSFTATLKTAGSQSISATDTELSNITGTQSGITTQPSIAEAIKIVTRPPGGVIAGKPFNVVIDALDAYNNVDTSYDNSVTLSGSPTLTGTLTMQAADGVASFNNVIDTKSESLNLSATSGTLGGDTASGISITPAAAFKFAITTTFANPDIAGTIGTVIVTAEDQYGNVENGSPPYEGTVDLSSSDAQITGLPVTYTFQPGDNGSHTFSNVILKSAGNQTIEATDSVSSTVTGNTTVIVVPAAAHDFVLTSSFANPDVAGNAGQVAVTAKDLYGNISGSGPDQYENSVDLTSTDGQVANLPPTYTFLPGDNGVHVFGGVVLKTAGSQSFTATDSVTNTIIGSSPSVNVVPAAAQDFVVTTTFANPDVAGSAATVTVTAQDLYGNTAGSGPNQYKGTVDISSTDPQVSGLPISYAFLAGDHGLHMFNSVLLASTGAQSFTATDSVSSATSGTSPTINVVPAAAIDFVVTTSFANPDSAGTTGTLTITAKDTYGNISGSGPEQYQGTVDLSSTDAQSSGIPSTYSFLPADHGSHVFNNVALKTTGNQSITAIDSLSSGVAGTSPTVNVIPANVHDFVISASFANPDVAGTAGSVTVVAKDLYGNTVGSSLNRYEGTVDLSTTDLEGSGLPLNYTFLPGDNGLHTFNNVVLKTAGGQSFKATDSVSSAITGSSPPVTVVAAAAREFSIATSFANPDVAGTAGAVTVTAKDIYGNIAGSGPNQYESTVDLTGSDSQVANLPPTYTFLPGDDGSHVFNNVVLKTAGGQSFTGTDSIASSINGTSASVTVVPAAAQTFVVTSSFASPDVAGTTGLITLTAKDPYGNIAASGPDEYKGTVDLTSTDHQLAGLAATYTFLAGDHGTHTFGSAVLETAGNQTITVTDSVSSSLSATTAAVTVVPGHVHGFVLTTSFANPDAAGTVGSVTVTAKDMYGNTTGTGSNAYLGTVTLTSTDLKQAGLPASHVFTPSDAGTYTFTGVVLETAGSQTITATDTISSTVAGSTVVNVSPGAAFQLAMTEQPPNPIVAGQPFTVAVSAEDKYGNLVPSYSGSVTISLSNDPNLSGTVFAKNGVATFTSLSTTLTSDQGSAIQATASGLKPVSSNPLTVMPVSQAPTVLSEQVLHKQKTNKKGKKIGKPVFAGFSIVYSTAMNPSTAGSHPNYQVGVVVNKKVKKKTMKQLQTVSFNVVYNPSNDTLTLSIIGNQPFKLGGQITINAGAPNGVTSSDSILLSGNTVFHILPGAKNIVPGRAL